MAVRRIARTSWRGGVAKTSFANSGSGTVRNARRNTSSAATKNTSPKTAGGPDRVTNSAALEALTTFDWPGNVRQLENAIERLVLFARGSTIEPDDLPPP